VVLIKTRAALWIVLIAICLSCAGRNDGLRDGYYTAVAADFDKYGWKEYVTICVSGGRITMVEYNAFNYSGFIKSWDMEYMRVMNAEDGTYPNAYTRFYGRQFLEHQGTSGVDLISGATTSYRTFIALADAAVENARRGDTETVLVSSN
jgi:major membrane immunogen (membrane-anchored lipoprotein)